MPSRHRHRRLHLVRGAARPRAERPVSVLVPPDRPAIDATAGWLSVLLPGAGQLLRRRWGPALRDASLAGALGAVAVTVPAWRGVAMTLVVGVSLWSAADAARFVPPPRLRRV